MIRFHRLVALSGAFALVALPALASPQDGIAYHGGHMMWAGGWLGWFLGPLMMVFWLGLLVGTVVLILRWLGVSGSAEQHRRAATSGAVAVLRERFAKGEIDKAEFEERRGLLVN